MEKTRGSDLEFVGMLKPKKIAKFMREADSLKAASKGSFAKNLKENPPEVGDLVHILGDKKRQAYHFVDKSNMNPTSLPSGGTRGDRDESLNSVAG
jgi:hypothetical protein